MRETGAASDVVSRATADVVIVGGGAIGCALARELALRGVSVAVIERAEPGAEASGAAAGLLSPQADAVAPGPFFDLGVESRSLYPDWARELSEETGSDVGYRRTGILRCALPGDRARLSVFLWQREAGFALEHCDAAGVAARSDGRVSSEVREALFFPDEAIVDSRRLTRALWLSAERRGVRILLGTTARRFLVRGGICRGVETDRGAIEAARVVDAAGAWAAFDDTLPLRLPVAPVHGQIVQLETREGVLPTVIQSEEVYVVPRADGSLLLGSTFESVGFEKRVTAGAVQKLIGAATRLVPSLASARFVTAWAGLRPGTPDGLPVLGPSPVPGLYLATGHFRNGILLAPVTARILAEALTGKGSPELTVFSADRFAENRPTARPAAAAPPRVFR
ncbi:MAG TPA: glycine oxidase ThiO [Thermoanaerobaculia bacterium]|nr:glycine oxidase ThiO [Thermoanaerobaculia bacterium]